MPRKGSARDDARRRALQARASRDQARKLREARITTALADYYLAAGQAVRLREQAREKAGAILADGEKAARVPDASAAQAVRALRELLGGIAEVAGLCGLTQAAVRDLLASPKPAGSGAGAASGPRAPGPPQGARDPAGESGE